jgi:hypothetical protein
MYGLIGIGGKQLGASVETDPRSSDWKSEDWHTRWDFLSGLAATDSLHGVWQQERPRPSRVN